MADGIFRNEKELNDFLDQGMAGLMARYNIPETEIPQGIDFCHTLMAEYSRLLQEGKIKRPLTYSADYSAKREQDGSIKLLSDLIYGNGS